MPPATTIRCIDCGGRCHRTTLDDPEFGWQVGDVVAYRCADCADLWFLEVSSDDLDD